MIKLKLVFIIFLFTVLSNCNNRTKKNIAEEAHINISLYESHDLIDLYPSFLKANTATRKHELDSISKIKTGLSLLDRMNIEKAEADTIDGDSFDDFPLFKVFAPSVTSDGELNSSAILGVTKDPAGLLNFISKADTCFDENIQWKISGNTYGGLKFVYAINKVKEKIPVGLSQIDSFIISPSNFNSFGKVAQKLSDMTDLSEYLVEIKIKDEFKDKLESKVYTLIINVNLNEFSGSVTKHEKYTSIGNVNSKDLELLRSKFENRIKINKLQTVANKGCYEKP